MTTLRWFCFCRGSALRFFWLRRISMMADHRHHGKGEHDHRHVAMPAMPGSALVVICQSAFKFAPVSASNFDPLGRRVLTVALASSGLAGVAETRRARVV